MCGSQPAIYILSVVHKTQISDIQCIPLFRIQLRHGGIREHSPVQEFHDIKRGPDDVIILAETVCLGNRHVRLFQGVDNLVFPLDLVCRLGEQFAWRLLPKDIFLAVGAGDEVSGV